MPELAEVEFCRRRWDPGLGARVEHVHVQGGSRVFRQTGAKALTSELAGAVLKESRAAGKQLLFRFSGGRWVGLHLGMTGELKAEPPDYRPARHDHFILFQRRHSLVFTDPRQFGRVRFHQGSRAPDWWANQAPPIDSPQFTAAAVEGFLARHGRMPVKAVLLRQERFPGVGNWMADEILWRAGLHPATPGGRLGGEPARRLWRMVRQVCRGALRSVGRRGGDPPAGWLFHERWGKGGHCPRDGTGLNYDPIGGRTTAWCGVCQGKGS